MPGEMVSGRGNGQCKGAEVGMCLAIWRHKKGPVWLGQREGGRLRAEMRSEL